jgi:glycosyltransferase involved in cell wall biosynthesis
LTTVSILIPVYNRKEYISQCIFSALEQTHKNFEVLIIDNASTDGTWEICQTLSDADTRVRLLRNSENIGPLKNLLAGIKECKGQYIKVLFSDDLMAEDCLAEMVATIEKNPRGAMVIANVYSLKNGKIESVPLYKFNNKIITSEEYIDSVMFDNTMPLSPGACLFRRTDIESNYKSEITSPIDRRVDDHGAGADLLSMLLTAARYDYVCLIDKPLNLFREHAGSLSISKSGKQLSDCYVQAKVNFAAEYFSPRELRAALVKLYIFRCIGYKEIISPFGFMKIFGVKLNFFEIILINVSILEFLLRKIFGRFIRQ